MNTRIILLFFIGLSVFNLWAEYTTNTTFVFISKPLLMLSLGLWFAIETGLKSFFHRLILGALVFSMGGDTLLMVVENGGSSHFFLLGLGSFLITHLLYCLAFYIERKKGDGFLKKQPLVIVPLLIYFLGLSFYLLPSVPTEMQIPVAIYSFVVVLMAISCLNLNGILESKIFQLLFLGVLLFIVSDTIIALNKFKSDQLTIPFARVLIMIFYLTGQYLIVRGAAKKH